MEFINSLLYFQNTPLAVFLFFDGIPAGRQISAASSWGHIYYSLLRVQLIMESRCEGAVSTPPPPPPPSPQHTMSHFFGIADSTEKKSRAADEGFLPPAWLTRLRSTSVNVPTIQFPPNKRCLNLRYIVCGVFARRVAVGRQAVAVCTSRR